MDINGISSYFSNICQEPSSQALSFGCDLSQKVSDFASETISNLDLQNIGQAAPYILGAGAVVAGISLGRSISDMKVRLGKAETKLAEIEGKGRNQKIVNVALARGLDRTNKLVKELFPAVEDLKSKTAKQSRLFPSPQSISRNGSNEAFSTGEKSRIDSLTNPSTPLANSRLERRSSSQGELSRIADSSHSRSSSPTKVSDLD